ncbi:MAG: riboflavin synthase [Phycisphaerales bacterium]|nr:riboflavin synthase [Phycisphaerales bacterium]
MFTGLVQGVGTVVARSVMAGGQRLTIDGARQFAALRLGDSISVNGVCLTVADRAADQFCADVIPQTLSMTTLGSLAVGESVNLELALRMGDPMGGHIVQGHVDSIGEVACVDRTDGGVLVRVQLNAQAMDLVVAQGSITLQGVSLTIANRASNWFEVALIPETLARTTLASVAVGQRLNVEVDALARMIDQAVRRHSIPRTTG